MKRLSRFALSLAGAAALAPFIYAAPAMAASAAGRAEKSAVAKPMSAWLVGPSLASAFDLRDNPENAGCLMVTEFDNGMILGIHAREAGIVGMTIDTRSQTLVPGQGQAVGLNVGQNAYVLNGTATDSSTLALNLDEAGGGRQFVERLTGLGSFRLLIDEKPHHFATTGFTDGLARLQACMGSTMAVPVVVTGPGATAGKVTHDPAIETMKVTSSGHRTPLALAMPNLVPAGYKFVLEDVDPMTPVSWQAGEDWIVVMRQALEPHGLRMAIKGNTIRIMQRAGESDPVIDDIQLVDDQGLAERTQAAADIPEGVWGGAKGESLADVLEAWGLMAGVEVKVDLMGDLRLPRDVRYEGRFDEAVERLLSQFDGRDRPTGAFAGRDLATNVAADTAPAARTTASRMPAPRAPVTANERLARAAADREARAENRPRPAAQPAARAPFEPTAPLKQMRTIPDPPHAPKSVDGKAKAAPKAAAKAAPAKKARTSWEALEGTSLRDVLEHWGQDAGVNVVWMSSENYPLPKTIRKTGKFEDVVMEALAQYEGQGTRPVAQLNHDPETGEKALIIKTKRL